MGIGVMRLREVSLGRFRQFIDETISLDPRMTILVGRNDVGKTGFLFQFFDQCIFQEAIAGHDMPKVPDYHGDKIRYSMTWDVTDDDSNNFPLTEAFGPTPTREIQVNFDHSAEDRAFWTYLVNGQEVQAYEGTGNTGSLIRRKVLRYRSLFPVPHYIGISDRHTMPSSFEAQFYKQKPASEFPRMRDYDPTERLLLKLAGFSAQTRHGKGIEEPWRYPVGSPCPLEIAEIKEGLGTLSKRVTQKLRQWWHDTPGLTFTARVPDRTYQHDLNSFLISWEVSEPGGLPLYGSGMRWFVTFILEILNVEDQKGPLLLLFDEPATTLHPGAQRGVAKVLNDLSQQYQIICSTHSPFLLDWNYPQRIRLFERDVNSKRTFIRNKPYSPTGTSSSLIWDPLRASIGVTVGDVAVFGDINIMVEGITDQIMLANLSSVLESQGRMHLDLEKATIIPYGDQPALKYLVSMARSRGLKTVVLTDSDEQGKVNQATCKSLGTPYVVIGDLIGGSKGDAAIEDIIGIAHYINHVNSVYRSFDWFKPLEPEYVAAEIGNYSLGAHLTRLFHSTHGQSFSKIAVTLSIIESAEQLPQEVLNGMEQLIQKLQEAIPEG